MDEQSYNNVKGIYENNDGNKREQIHNYFVSTMIKDNIKKYGEVLTPPCLVDDMINTIPFEFWLTHRRILEPCCGKGNFLLAIFDKLLDNMCDFPIKESIYEIINDSLVFLDINPINVEICIQLLELHCKYRCPKINLKKLKFNSFCCDSLNYIGNYDAVITNPPYNSNGLLGTGNSLYQKFIIRGLKEWLKPDGYLLYVTPASWRKPSSVKCKYDGIFNLMTKENQLVYVNMNDNKTGRNMFGCDTKYDYYLIQNRKCDQDTLVIDYKNDEVIVDLRKHEFLPNFEINLIYSLLAKDVDTKLRIYKNKTKYDARNKNTSYIENAEFKYPLVHSTPLKGTRFIYCKEKDDTDFTRRKVIIGMCGIKHTVNDYDGLYGITNNSYGIDIDSKEHGNLLDKAFLSDQFKKVLKAVLFGNFNVDFNFLSLLKDDFYVNFV